MLLLYCDAMPSPCMSYDARRGSLLSGLMAELEALVGPPVGAAEVMDGKLGGMEEVEAEELADVAGPRRLAPGVPPGGELLQVGGRERGRGGGGERRVGGRTGGRKGGWEQQGRSLSLDGSRGGQ